MGIAFDTVAFAVTNPGAAPAAGNVAAVTGDSLVTRNFTPGTKAYLDVLGRQGATSGFIEVRSPSFHDNVRGIHLVTPETPAQLLLPRDVDQPIQPGDTLTVTISGGAAEIDIGFLGIYYADLPGVNAMLKNWADLKSYTLSIKPVEVDFTTTAGGAWLDTAITTTENLLKTDRYYAVTGYITDTAVNALGVKGAATGNLRICGPGPTTTLRTDEYFIRQNEYEGRPYIPIFNGNDKGAVFVCASAVASAATKATLMLAELDPAYRG